MTDLLETSNLLDKNNNSPTIIKPILIQKDSPPPEKICRYCLEEKNSKEMINVCNCKTPICVNCFLARQKIMLYNKTKCEICNGLLKIPNEIIDLENQTINPSDCSSKILLLLKVIFILIVISVVILIPVSQIFINIFK